MLKGGEKTDIRTENIRDDFIPRLSKKPTSEQNLAVSGEISCALYNFRILCCRQYLQRSETKINIFKGKFYGY